MFRFVFVLCIKSYVAFTSPIWIQTELFVLLILRWKHAAKMFLTPLCLPPQEDCSVQSVWTTGGLSILTSVPLVPQYACLLCASKGQHEVHPDCSSLQHSLKKMLGQKKVKVNFRFLELFIIMGKFHLYCLSNITCFFFFSSWQPYVVQMLYCQVCCEPFHRFCLDPSEHPLEENKENWCCRHCKFCRICGLKNKESKVVCDASKHDHDA